MYRTVVFNIQIMFKQSASDYIYPRTIVEKPMGMNVYLPIEIDIEEMNCITDAEFANRIKEDLARPELRPKNQELLKHKPAKAVTYAGSQFLKEIHKLSEQVSNVQRKHRR